MKDGMIVLRRGRDPQLSKKGKWLKGQKLKPLVYLSTHAFEPGEPV